MQGWIKLHRQMLNHWVASEPDALAIWVRLLLEANHTTSKKLLGGRIAVVQRGQLIFSYQRFSEKSGLSIAKIRRVIRHLTKEGMIDMQSDNKFSIITITCFDDFQESTSKSHADDRQKTGKKHHYKNVKNDKNELIHVVSDNTTSEQEPKVNQVSKSQKLPPLKDPETGKVVYTEEFEWIWARRPPRVGTNNKLDAYKACRARIKDGHTWREMAEGLARYSRYANESKILNTRHVQMVRTFFGPAKHFLEDWEAQQNAAATESKLSTKTSATERVAAAWDQLDNQSLENPLADRGGNVRAEVDQGLGGNTIEGSASHVVTD